MKARFLKLLKIYSIVFAAGAAYAFFVSVFKVGIPCMFHLITGLDCPSCGTTRMVVSVLKGDFSKAYEYNRLMFVLLPLFMFYFIKLNIKYIKYGRVTYSRLDNAVVVVLIAVLVIFGIYRNIFL